MLDLVEVFLEAPTRVWRNVGSGTADAPKPLGNWLAVRVEQPGPNRAAIGGWLEVRSGTMTVRRELTIGGGHLSGEGDVIHIGLGGAASAEVRVEWPDGEVGPWLPSDANQSVVIDRGAPTVRVSTPSGEPRP
jgi:hypothetical protein